MMDIAVTFNKKKHSESSTLVSCILGNINNILLEKKSIAFSYFLCLFIFHFYFLYLSLTVLGKVHKSPRKQLWECCRHLSTDLCYPKACLFVQLLLVAYVSASEWLGMFTSVSKTFIRTNSYLPLKFRHTSCPKSIWTCRKCSHSS